VLRCNAAPFARLGKLRQIAAKFEIGKFTAGGVMAELQWTKEETARFTAMMKAIAERYKDEPDFVFLPVDACRDYWFRRPKLTFFQRIKLWFVHRRLIKIVARGGLNEILQRVRRLRVGQ
jgi:hypothetical protein